MTASDRVEVWRSCCRPSVAVAAPFVWDASLVRPSLRLVWFKLAPDRSVSAWTFSIMRLMLCTIVPGRFSVSVPNSAPLIAMPSSLRTFCVTRSLSPLRILTPTPLAPSAARLRHDLEPAHPAPQVMMP
jgi:hypothetical protein